MELLPTEILDKICSELDLLSLYMTSLTSKELAAIATATYKRFSIRYMLEIMAFKRKYNQAKLTTITLCTSEDTRLAAWAIDSGYKPSVESVKCAMINDDLPGVLFLIDAMDLPDSERYDVIKEIGKEAAMYTALSVCDSLQAREVYIKPYTLMRCINTMVKPPCVYNDGIQKGYIRVQHEFLVDLFTSSVQCLDLNHISPSRSEIIRYILSTDSFWELPIIKSPVPLDIGQFRTIWQDLTSKISRKRLVTNWRLDSDCISAILSQGYYSYYKLIKELPPVTSNCFFDPFRHAATRGLLETLDWIKSLGYDVNQFVTSSHMRSCFHTNFDSAMWAIEKGADAQRIMQDAITTCSKTRVIADKLNAWGVPWPQNAGQLAIQAVSDPVEWIHSRRLIIPPNIADIVAWTSSLEVLENVMKHGYRPSINYPLSLVHSYTSMGIYYTPCNDTMAYLFRNGYWRDFDVAKIGLIEGDLDIKFFLVIEKELRPLTHSDYLVLLQISTPCRQPVVWVADRVVRSGGNVGEFMGMLDAQRNSSSYECKHFINHLMGRECPLPKKTLEKLISEHQKLREEACDPQT